jgi:hypothetical protein
MVFLTLKGGTQLLSFNNNKERDEYCKKRGILMYSQDNPLFTNTMARKIRKNFPFLK